MKRLQYVSSIPKDFEESEIRLSFSQDPSLSALGGVELSDTPWELLKPSSKIRSVS